jgi:hypothetical protein
MATSRQAVEGETMILVLERKTTARLGEDLDVASSGASLGSGRHGCGESTAEWLRDTEC